MLKLFSVTGILAGFMVASISLRAAGFASSVIAFTPGTGFAKEFGSGLGYTNSMAILGEPSRVTPGQFGGPIDPFSPPYLRDQILSIGAGGSVTVRFESPAIDSPSNPFGIDFIIFGASGFVITNGDFSGGGITDGSLFGASTGKTRVSVSNDNVRYFALDPALAPPVDGLSPTDGAGDFFRPVDPAISGAKMNGLDLDGIRSLYAGSAGGAGYDIAWARDEDGAPVSLGIIRFVKVEVLEGVSEIDGMAALPSGPVFAETFDNDPRERGWAASGGVSLFRWDSQKQDLKVTWDSGKQNSFYSMPLKTVLRKSDDFSLGFEISLDRIAVGLRPDRPYTFQLALGLLNSSDALDSPFLRGSGTQSPNLVEFDYFPDSGFGATISPVIVSGQNQFVPGFSYPLEMTLGAVFRVTMNFDAASQTLATSMWRDGEPFGPIKAVTLPASFGDFHVDAFAVSSFSDTGADGSILAEGFVDNVWAHLPDPPVQRVSGTLFNGEWRMDFLGRLNWMYVLEGSEDVENWRSVGTPISGVNGMLRLTDPNPAAGKRFYRVRAEAQ